LKADNDEKSIQAALAIKAFLSLAVKLLAPLTRFVIDDFFSQRLQRHGSNNLTRKCFNVFGTISFTNSFLTVLLLNVILCTAY